MLSQARGCRSRGDGQLPAAPGKRPVPDLIASPGERLTPESPESKVLLGEGSGFLCHHSLRLLIFIDEEQGPGRVRLQPGYKQACLYISNPTEWGIVTQSCCFICANLLSVCHGFLDTKQIPTKEEALRRRTEQEVSSTSCHRPCYRGQNFTKNRTRHRTPQSFPAILPFLC